MNKTMYRNEFKKSHVMDICLAYEKGATCGIRRKGENPYEENTQLYWAWDYGYEIASGGNYANLQRSNIR